MTTTEALAASHAMLDELKLRDPWGEPLPPEMTLAQLPTDFHELWMAAMEIFFAGHCTAELFLEECQTILKQHRENRFKFKLGKILEKTEPESPTARAECLKAIQMVKDVFDDFVNGEAVQVVSMEIGG